MPGWTVPVHENFSVNKWAPRKQTIEIVLRGFCLFSFSNFTLKAKFWLSWLPSKKVGTNSIDF